MERSDQEKIANQSQKRMDLLKQRAKRCVANTVVVR